MSDKSESPQSFHRPLEQLKNKETSLEGRTPVQKQQQFVVDKLAERDEFQQNLRKNLHERTPVFNEIVAASLTDTTQWDHIQGVIVKTIIDVLPNGETSLRRLVVDTKNVAEVPGPQKRSKLVVGKVLSVSEEKCLAFEKIKELLCKNEDSKCAERAEIREEYVTNADGKAIVKRDILRILETPNGSVSKHESETIADESQRQDFGRIAQCLTSRNDAKFVKDVIVIESPAQNSESRKVIRKEIIVTEYIDKKEVTMSDVFYIYNNRPENEFVWRIVKIYSTSDNLKNNISSVVCRNVTSNQSGENSISTEVVVTDRTMNTSKTKREINLLPLTIKSWVQLKEEKLFELISVIEGRGVIVVPETKKKDVGLTIKKIKKEVTSKAVEAAPLKSTSPEKSTKTKGDKKIIEIKQHRKTEEVAVAGRSPNTVNCKDSELSIEKQKIESKSKAPVIADKSSDREIGSKTLSAQTNKSTDTSAAFPKKIEPKKTERIIVVNEHHTTVEVISKTKSKSPKVKPVRSDSAATKSSSQQSLDGGKESQESTAEMSIASSHESLEKRDIPSKAAKTVSPEKREPNKEERIVVVNDHYTKVEEVTATKSKSPKVTSSKPKTSVALVSATRSRSPETIGTVTFKKSNESSSKPGIVEKVASAKYKSESKAPFGKQNEREKDLVSKRRSRSKDSISPKNKTISPMNTSKQSSKKRSKSRTSSAEKSKTKKGEVSPNKRSKSLDTVKRSSERKTKSPTATYPMSHSNKEISKRKSPFAEESKEAKKNGSKVRSKSLNNIKESPKSKTISPKSPSKHSSKERSTSKIPLFEQSKAKISDLFSSKKSKSKEWKKEEKNPKSRSLSKQKVDSKKKGVSGTSKPKKASSESRKQKSDSHLNKTSKRNKNGSRSKSAEMQAKSKKKKSKSEQLTPKKAFKNLGIDENSDKNNKNNKKTTKKTSSELSPKKSK